MRNRFLRMLYHSGLMRLWLNLQPKAVTFIMLHGVMSKEQPSTRWQPFRSYLSPTSLDKILSLLSDHYEFISIDDAVEILNGTRALDRHYCVLTFDDGLRNNLTHALPVLRRHKAPGIFYLVTNQIELNEPFWFDRLDFAIQSSAGLVKEVEVFGEKVELNCSNQTEMKNTFLRIKNMAYRTGHSYDEVHNQLLKVIGELESHSGMSLLDIYSDDPWSKVVDWQDVEAATADPYVTFGSHTVNHSLLGMLGEEEITYQLEHSKAQIEQHTNKNCVHFCYPNGDIHPKSGALLERAGYVSAVSTVRGKNRKETCDLYSLKRVNMPNTDDAVSALASISGFRDFLAAG